jgi:hypothetical protein
MVCAGISGSSFAELFNGGDQPLDLQRFALRNLNGWHRRLLHARELSGYGRKAHFDDR